MPKITNVSTGEYTTDSRSMAAYYNNVTNNPKFAGSNPTATGH